MKIMEYLSNIKIFEYSSSKYSKFNREALGKIFYKKLDERREIARWNLEKCFPRKQKKKQFLN